MEPPKKKNSKFQNLFQKLKNNLTQKKVLSKAPSTPALKKESASHKLESSFKKPPELPKNFAEDLLNLELEMEEINFPSLINIKKLLELYIIGVEYYETINSQRYLIFKNKINVLMAKPKIIEILNQNESMGKIYKTTDCQRAYVEKQEKKKMLDLHIFLSSKQTDESMEDKAKNKMNSQALNMKTKNKIIMKEMDIQEKNILNRLEERKRAVSFIVEPSDIAMMDKERNEEFKKNSMLLLKKNSKEIGTMVNKLQLRNSLRKSKNIKDEVENSEEINQIIQKYEKELQDLKKNLKDKEKSLLITKLIEKIENERENAIEAWKKNHNN